VEEICRQGFPVVEVKPFIACKIGIVTTGSEIYSGRIEDRFGPVLREKFGDLNGSITRQILTSDDVEMTTNAIYEYLLTQGIPQETLDQVHSPIGLSIGAQTPEEIAVSIVAELIQVRKNHQA
jgi:hypothetical protein